MFLQVQGTEEWSNYHQGHNTTAGSAHTSYVSLVKYMFLGCDMSPSTKKVTAFTSRRAAGVCFPGSSGVPLGEFLCVIVEGESSKTLPELRNSSSILRS